MPLIKRTENFYQSLIPPPEGCSLEWTELLQPGDPPTREESEMYREFGIRDPGISINVFRCRVRTASGTLYTSSVIESVAELCRKDFWEDFWEQVRLTENKA